MSNFDRGGKYYAKKKFQSQKDNSNFGGRNYYGKRSPSNSSSHDNPTKHYDKDFPKDPSGRNETPVKIKQPTILLKAREPTEESVNVPKGVQKDHDTSNTSVQIASSSTSSEPQTRTVKRMTKSVKFLDDATLYSENVQDFLQENNDFLVVGVIGGQGVGKSTLLNLLAHKTITEDIKKAVFEHIEMEKLDDINDGLINTLNENLNSIKINEEAANNHKIQEKIFKVQSRVELETNSVTTHGIDLFITSNRVIFLDCQPFNSVSILDEMVQSENKRSNIVNEFMLLENSGEIQGLQLATFLMSVCHVLIVVQDWFYDCNVIRFLQTAEMLKPTHSNPEDELLDHFPHLLVVHNYAQMEDFSPRKFKTIQETYNMFFLKTKLEKDTNLGLCSSRLIPCLNEESCGDSFNVFLIPEYRPDELTVYSGHPPLEVLIKKLRANILASMKTPLTHVLLTEKTWVNYCQKVWDNVKKSSFFVEYTRLMP